VSRTRETSGEEVSSAMKRLSTRNGSQAIEAEIKKTKGRLRAYRTEGAALAAREEKSWDPRPKFREDK